MAFSSSATLMELLSEHRQTCAMRLSVHIQPQTLGCGECLNPSNQVILKSSCLSELLLTTAKLSTIAKHYRCCIQNTWRENSTETRQVGMFDGTALEIEGYEPPFLDVVYQHWEEAMMHLTLNGEVQDEEQQS